MLHLVHFTEELLIYLLIKRFLSLTGSSRFSTARSGEGGHPFAAAVKVQIEDIFTKRVRFDGIPRVLPAVNSNTILLRDQLDASCDCLKIIAESLEHLSPSEASDLPFQNLISILNVIRHNIQRIMWVRLQYFHDPVALATWERNALFQE